MAYIEEAECNECGEEKPLTELKELETGRRNYSNEFVPDYICNACQKIKA